METLHARLLHERQRHHSAGWAASDWHLGACLCHLSGAAEELGEAAQAPECSCLHGSERNAQVGSDL